MCSEITVLPPFFAVSFGCTISLRTHFLLCLQCNKHFAWIFAVFRFFSLFFLFIFEHHHRFLVEVFTLRRWLNAGITFKISADDFYIFHRNGKIVEHSFIMIYKFTHPAQMWRWYCLTEAYVALSAPPNTIVLSMKC